MNIAEISILVMIINFIVWYSWRAILRKIDRSYESFNKKFILWFAEYSEFTRTLLPFAVAVILIIYLINKYE
jgi:hypothetical protein